MNIENKQDTGGTMNTEELELNFETGKVMRGETELMTLEEMIFLVGSAVQYNNMFPIQQSEEFVANMRESIGLGFTKEQFEEIKTMMKNMQEE